jgi:hypothetical protein
MTSQPSGPSVLPPLPAIPGGREVDRIEIWNLMLERGQQCYDAGVAAERERLCIELEGMHVAQIGSATDHNYFAIAAKKLRAQ